MPALSVIIPWSNRPEIEITLANNRAIFDAIGAEVLIVNCGGDRSMLAAAIQRSGNEKVRWLEIPVARFNKCLALNLGAHSISSDVMFTLDSDVILHPGFLETALSRVSNEVYVSLQRVIESDPRPPVKSFLVSMAQTTELITREGKAVRFENQRLYFEDGSEAGPGLVMIQTRNFRAVGGMNSQLIGWGYEDLDFHLRLNAVLGLSHSRFGEATHLTHGDEKRMLHGTTQAASQRLNMTSCYEKYARGDFMGTFALDVQRWAGLVKVQDPSTDGALKAFG